MSKQNYPAAELAAFSGRTLRYCLVSFSLGALVPCLYILWLKRRPADPLDLCSTVVREGDVQHPEVCVEPAFSLDGPNSDWHRLKRLPPLAPCTVQGMPIERLEPDLNFRRPFALRFTEDVEDKTHLLPFLRATHDMSLQTRQRRVLLDMGGREFASSVLWFMEWYPLEFTEVYVFEAWASQFQKPNPTGNAEKDIYGTMNNHSQVAAEAQANLSDSALERIKLRVEYVNSLDEEKPGQPKSVNITRVIKDELKLTKDDAVIAKMDIEWAEWRVLPQWLEDLEMPHIIDELFVEVHYQHPTMFPEWWNQGPPREEALKMYQALRDKGFYVHPWP